MASKARVILHVFLITFAYAEGYGHGSCRYNCGGYSSDCSCDYNCWNYGTCCSDFCDHCAYMSYGSCSYYSTTEIPEPTSIEPQSEVSRGQGSCRYNCGRYSSDCSCDYNCQYYGSCCSDFCDHCPYINYGYCSVYSTTASLEHTESQSEVSRGQGSCRYNCGGYSSDCSCNYNCRYSGNCCSDFCDHCPYINYGYCSVYSTTVSQSEVSRGQGSCRYNCGGYSSDCSCNYNCRYSGNCCSDFCDHCPYINYGYCSVYSTTAGPTEPQSEVSRGQGSCRYNCGRYSSDCSCDYNCQYYGSCCSDFCDHCPYINYGYCGVYSTTAKAPDGSCGGYLDDVYGSVHSPNYPFSYPNYAQCIWYIRGGINQRIKLVFTYVELELTSTCSYDYIAVYDGPSTNSRLLSKFCQGSDQIFSSSSNSMTIYFRSDSSVTKRGFTAAYYILPNDDDILTCSTDYMEAKINRSYLNLLGFNEHNLYLNDRDCRPSITSNEVVFKIPLNRCGTERQENNGSIIYSNTIRTSPSDSVITRETNLQFNIGCEMQQDTMVKIMYVTNESLTGDIVDNVTESGRYNVSMTFYDSSSFIWPVLDSPYYVDLRQNLFLQVNLHSSDPYLVVFVDTCTASPYSYDWISRTYDLIKNGCARDGTYETYPSPANGVARFKFNAFKFINLYPSVYLQCKLVVCEAYDYSSRCYRGCLSRKKRATSSSRGSTDVLIGPIELKKAIKVEGFE
ncbi:CUB and zona pellucida-like domain-containing protein 1 isoform X3 [Scyliorhinus canicula]|uniref:CUB and zona pellucida-like domain-containing protein 1 isoform X3 n=1 Tax=Scyliorhinus canicula TaxID=7830 RepID=UPI0018F70543|nr:CUB and zona pellucida-like domain-containing protein 1 isoform X3 [Scyliorhinus canicula]